MNKGLNVGGVDKCVAVQNKLNHLACLQLLSARLTDAHFGMYVTEIESPYHAIITVSSYMIEISTLQLIIETEK